MTAAALGRPLPNIQLFLTEASSYNDTVERDGPNGAWSTAPQLEFPRDDETWTTTIDPEQPSVAVFTEDRTTVATRVEGEAWRLRDTATDEIIAKGTVTFQATT